MVNENVPYYYDQVAVVEKVTAFHAYIKLLEGPATGSEHSVFINNIRLPGIVKDDVQVCTMLTDSVLKVGHEVRAYYATVNERIVILYLVVDQAQKPTLIEVQDAANELIATGSRIHRRLVKNIEFGDATETPAHLKSAKSVPSPIDMSNVLIEVHVNGHPRHALAAGDSE